MSRYFNLMRVFFANSLQLELEYRISLVIGIINTLLVFIASFVVLFAMFEQAPALGGWTFEEALTLFGVFLLLQALTEIILMPNLNKLPEYVRTGALDFILLKPASAQFQISLRFIGIWKIPDLLLGVGVIAYSMAALGTATATNLGLLAIMLCSACAITYSIWLMLMTTAFWFVKVDNIFLLFSTFLNAGRFPVTAFPGWGRIILTFIVPIAFVTTVPASAAIGRLTPDMALASIVIGAGFMAASHLFWRRALKSYTSASS